MSEIEEIKEKFRELQTRLDRLEKCERQKIRYYNISCPNCGHNLTICGEITIKGKCDCCGNEIEELKRVKNPGTKTVILKCTTRW